MRFYLCSARVCVFFLTFLALLPLSGCDLLALSPGLKPIPTGDPPPPVPIVSISAPSKSSILPTESVIFNLSIVGGAGSQLSEEKIELVSEADVKCSNLDLSEVSDSAAVFTVGACSGKGAFSIRVLRDAIFNDDGEGNKETKISGKVVVLKASAPPPPSPPPPPPPSPPPPPGPGDDPACTYHSEIPKITGKGFLPELNLSGFPGWYGLRSVRMGVGVEETHVWCFNLQKDQQKLIMSIIDRTGAWQCFYHTAEYIPPVDSGLRSSKWTDATTNTIASFRTWGKGYLPKGVWKIKLTTSSYYSDCPFTYEINAHP